MLICSLDDQRQVFNTSGCIFALLLSFLNGESQTNGDTKYPQGYFANPLNIPMSLSANFGELRPNHWHMGLDIRTDQKENFPVFASADGYVAHIGIRPLEFWEIYYHQSSEWVFYFVCASE